VKHKPGTHQDDQWQPNVERDRDEQRREPKGCGEHYPAEHQVERPVKTNVFPVVAHGAIVATSGVKKARPTSSEKPSGPFLRSTIVLPRRR